MNFSEITLKNILSYLEGQGKYYLNEIVEAPPYIKEQIVWRLSLCVDDCLKDNKCKYCGCPPRKKAWVNESCNNNERFPDLMDKISWENFKILNEITIDKSLFLLLKTNNK